MFVGRNYLVGCISPFFSRDEQVIPPTDKRRSILLLSSTRSRLTQVAKQVVVSSNEQPKPRVRPACDLAVDNQRLLYRQVREQHDLTSLLSGTPRVCAAALTVFRVDCLDFVLSHAPGHISIRTIGGWV